jgi:hypothetical protein
VEWADDGPRTTRHHLRTLSPYLVADALEAIAIEGSTVPFASCNVSNEANDPDLNFSLQDFCVWQFGDNIPTVVFCTL